MRDESAVSGWATGFVVFAGVLMILIGIFHAIAGLAAIFEDQFYVLGPNYAYDVDVTAWGWIHLILGLIVVGAGYGVFSGALWARTVGITLALISAVANFFFIPYYPIWSIIIIAIDILIIWALSVYGPRQARAAGV
jgi:hypothetical protein